MPKELLVKILAEKDYFSIFLLAIIYAVGAFTYLQLGSQIVGKKIDLPKIWYGILAESFYIVIGKLVLPNNTLYGLVLLVVMTTILKATSKASWLKSFWSTVLILLTSSIGVLIIAEPLGSANKNIAAFLLGSPLGCALGSLIETLFPALALFILMTFKITLPIPTGKRITFLDVMSIIIFGDVFFMLYSAFAQTLVDFKITSKLSLTMNVASQWAGAIFGGVAFYVFLAYIRNDQLKRENDQRKREEEINILLSRIEGVINDNMNSAGYIVKKCEGSVLIEIRLTPQDLEIIRLVIQGKKNAEIGEAMHLSEGTIRNYVTDILGKLGLPNREELAKYAIQRELLTIDDKKENY